MKRLLATLAGMTMLAMASVASAEDATGKITTINTEDQQVTLDSGMSFTLSEGMSLEGLKVGDEVLVTYEKQDGQNVATEIAPAKAE